MKIVVRRMLVFEVCVDVYRRKRLIYKCLVYIVCKRIFVVSIGSIVYSVWFTISQMYVCAF